jgi:hypothetical protein
VAGKESAFDTAAEDAAFAAPQPQWGVYDPQLVKLQVRACVLRAGLRGGM